jgi:hypothetical protein
VSLWQKIFGTPAESPKPIEISPPIQEGEVQTFSWSDREERRYPDKHDEIELDQGEPASAVEEGFGGEHGLGTAAPEEGEAIEQPAGERKRHRPRRRRGRGQRPDERSGNRRERGRGREGDLLETPGADDFEDLGADEEAAEIHADDLGEEEEGVAEAADGERRRSKPAGHRSIPSWDEAIGMIVEVNMQSRSQRRPSGGLGPRGRSRGGRRRRKPT